MVFVKKQRGEVIVDVCGVMFMQMKSEYASLVPADRDKSAWCSSLSQSSTDTTQPTT